VLIQQRLIARVRQTCAGDGRLDAALMYGSFAQGVGDEHSDIEFWLFFRPGERPDPHEWCARIAPPLGVIRNEFGAHVAFFPPLVRGEFHFATTAEIASVGAWPARGAPVEAMLVKDAGGLLRPMLEALPQRVTPEGAAELCGRFANWVVLAHHVAARGETLRAWDALGHVHRHLLWLTRLAAERTGTWLTPSRRAEADLPPGLADTTAAADPAQIRAALREAWRQGRDLWVRLAPGEAPEALLSAIDREI
jgi:lincosamide nucleotidyltransferase B/F